MGLNLNTPRGVGDLHKIRPDFQNQHTWATDLPARLGLGRDRPRPGCDSLFVAAQLIQNSTDFQNYVIWVCEKGRWQIADWDFRSGHWHSPYGIENLRTFRKVGSE